MILQASTIVFIGSHLSIPGKQKNHETGQEEDKPPLETMDRKDVMKFPFYGSAALFGLYCLFKFQKELANLLLGLYFTGLGVLALAGLIASLLQPFFRGKFWSKVHQFNIPMVDQVSVTVLEVLCICLCGGVGYIYYTTHHWCTNNLFGISFSIRGIEMLSLGSFVNGAILLSGLFVYDVFWVFGTDVMVTVAKSFQAPIKLVFPRDWSAPVGQQFSMLGLGDIVIPGLFIALLLRWDIARAVKQGKTITEGCKVFFYTNFIAYILGLVMTVVFMIWFKAAQPALLYLVPACLGAALLTAMVTGQLSDLLAYKEESPEKKEEEDSKKKE
uniref:Signal peptide peptidase n=1 Tax=Hanusia phi TaxID=3032 RepID=A0A7S0NF84_9CRYP